MIRRVCQCVFRALFLLIQAPTKTNDRERICEYNSQLSVNCIYIVHCFLLHPTQMSLTIDMKMILSLKCSGSHCRSVTSFWILSRKPNVVIPGNILLELRRHSVDSIHIIEVIVIWSNRIISHFLHAEHRVGEDVGIGSSEPISLFTLSLSTSTWLLWHQKCLHTSDFILITDQFCSFAQ